MIEPRITLDVILPRSGAPVLSVMVPPALFASNSRQHALAELDLVKIGARSKLDHLLDSHLPRCRPTARRDFFSWMERWAFQGHTLSREHHERIRGLFDLWHLEAATLVSQYGLAHARWQSLMAFHQSLAPDTTIFMKLRNDLNALTDSLQIRKNAYVEFTEGKICNVSNLAHFSESLKPERFHAPLSSRDRFNHRMDQLKAKYGFETAAFFTAAEGPQGAIHQMYVHARNRQVDAAHEMAQLFRDYLHDLGYPVRRD